MSLAATYTPTAYHYICAAGSLLVASVFLSDRLLLKLSPASLSLLDQSGRLLVTIMAASISVFSSRMPTAALSSAARPARLIRHRCIVRASKDEVPPNVAEARAWIAAWRAKQQGAPAAASAASGNGKKASKAAKANAAAAPAPAGHKLGASQAMADGTLVFTADQLKSVAYSDVLKKK